MTDPTEPKSPEPPNLRFLRLLVTVLTAVMIVGVATISVVLVMRLSAPQRPALPDEIALPEGATARAVTFGAGWYAVVTAGDEILIFEAGSGALRQRIAITAD